MMFSWNYVDPCMIHDFLSRTHDEGYELWVVNLNLWRYVYFYKVIINDLMLLLKGSKCYFEMFSHMLLWSWLWKIFFTKGLMSFSSILNYV